jgi:hypothetical protein
MSDNKDDQQQTEFSPFDSNVKERDYTKPLKDNTITFIPDAQFTPPNAEDLRLGLQSKMEESELGGIRKESIPGTSQAPNPGSPARNPSNSVNPSERFSANPSMSEMDDSDKHRAAKSLVEAAIDGYARLNVFAAGLAKFPMRKIKQMEREGQINTRLQLNMPDGKVPIGFFMEQYNLTMDGILEVGDEFRKKVTPVAIRVAKKYNMGMSDEMMLGYYLSTDIIAKAAILYQLRLQTTDLLEDFKEMKSAGYKGASNNTEATTANPPPQAQQTTTPSGPPESGPKNPSSGTSGEEATEEQSKRQFFEPEEKPPVHEQFQEPLESATSAPGSAQAEEPKIITPAKSRQKKKMPEFGDKSILDEMERIAKGKRK